MNSSGSSPSLLPSRGQHLVLISPTAQAIIIKLSGLIASQHNIIHQGVASFGFGTIPHSFSSLETNPMWTGLCLQLKTFLLQKLSWSEKSYHLFYEFWFLFYSQSRFRVEAFGSQRLVASVVWKDPFFKPMIRILGPCFPETFLTEPHRSSLKCRGLKS